MKILKRIFGSAWFKLFIAIIVMVALLASDRIGLNVFANLQGSWGWLILAFLLMLPPYIVVSYRFFIVLRNQGLEVRLRQAIHWTMIGSFFDVAMPGSSGGDVIKAAYIFNDLEAGSRTRGLMAVAFDRILGLIGLFLLAIITMSIGWQTVKELPGSIEIFLFLGTMSFGVLGFFYIAGSRTLSRSAIFKNLVGKLPASERLFKLIDCFRSLREHRGELALILALSVLNHLFWCSALLCITIAFKETIEPVVGFTIFPLAIFSNVFGFAGGFGVGTVGFDLIFSLLLNIQTGATIGLTFQTLSLLSRLAGLPFFLLRSSNTRKKISSLT